MTYTAQPERMITTTQAQLLTLLLLHMSEDQIKNLAAYLRKVSCDTGYGRVTMIIEAGQVKFMEWTGREQKEKRNCGI